MVDIFTVEDEEIPEHVLLMADGVLYAHAYGYTTVPQDEVECIVPITGAGRETRVYVNPTGRPAFVLTLRENGSCTHHETSWDPSEPVAPGTVNGTWHQVEIPVDPVDHTSITE